ncbi:MAG TPA: hypothetical protein VLH08_11825, partial [Acidobacteriota bacterium]|nr:hypothetical protein [Acidobacteriota bacterium]
MLPQLRRILILLFLISCIQNSLAVEPQTQQEFRSGEELLANEKFAEAVLVFEVRLKEFELQKNSKAVADTLYHLGICYNSLAQYRKALDALTRAERIHFELGNKEAAARDLTERANSELLLANADQSISLSESALRVHREMGNRKGEADTLRYIGLAYVNKGNFQKAMEYA